ncbi:MAG: ABC transporter permease [Chloroflexi bacterium]|nr:ABC transporter permease [Chloroflexota bacterium]
MNTAVYKGIGSGRQIRGSIVNWWREFSKSRMGVIGLVLFAIMVIFTLLAPVLRTYNPYENSYDILKAPSLAHWFGTDTLGRDLYSVLLYAGRNSLFVGVVTATIVISFSTLVGLLAGYFGGIVDEILMRTADVLQVLPRLPLMIVMASMIGPSLGTIILVIAVLGWAQPARQIRALTMSLKNYDYVESTKMSGGSGLHIIFHHIFPNVSGVVVAHYVTEVVNIILLESGLSFLGLGDPLRFTWGQVLHVAQTNAAFSGGYWWWWMPTGLCITIVCFSLAFIGTTLNDRFVLKLKIRGKD